MAERTKRHIIVPTKGICNTPSDLTCNDEQLELCDGVALTNGELSPIQNLNDLYLRLGGRIEYVHDYAGNKRYIFSTDNRTKLYYSSEGKRADISIVRNENNQIGAKVVNGIIQSDVEISLQCTTTTYRNINLVAIDKNLNVKRKYTSVSQFFVGMQVYCPMAQYLYWSDDNHAGNGLYFKTSRILSENGLEIEIAYTESGSTYTLSKTLNNEDVTESGWIVLPVTTAAEDISITIPSDSSFPDYNKWCIHKYTTKEELLDANYTEHLLIDTRWRFNKGDINATYCGGVNITDMLSVLDRAKAFVTQYAIFVNTGTETDNNDHVFNYDSGTTEMDDGADYAQLNTKLYNISDIDDTISNFNRKVSEKDYTTEKILLQKNDTDVYISKVIENETDFKETNLISVTKSSEDDTTYVIFTPTDKESSVDDADNAAPSYLICDFENNYIKQVKSIGNTIIVNTTDGLFYFLWKGQYYKSLGNDIPQPHIKFRLKETSRESQEIGRFEFEKVAEENNVTIIRKRVNAWGFSYTYKYYSLYADSDKIDDVENFLAGGYAKLKKENVEDKKLFFNPFFARVAVKLYDGSYTYATQPILLFPTINGSVYVAIQGSETYMYIYPTYLTVTQTTDYSDYQDLVKDVTIFVTKPVEVLEFCKSPNNGPVSSKFLNQLIQKMKQRLDPSGMDVFSVNSNTKAHSDFEYCWPCVAIDENRYAMDSIHQKESDSFILYHKYPETDWDNIINTATSDAEYDNLRLPYTSFYKRRDTKDIVEDLIGSCGNFYKLCDIGVSPVNLVDTREFIRKATLSTLEEQEQLADGYYSFSKLLPDSIDTYNRRLILLSCTRSAFKGFDSFNAYERVWRFIDGWHYKVTINDDYGERVVDKTVHSSEVFGEKLWFYYPDTHATHIEISDNNGNVYFSKDLKEHPKLNGAYYFEDFPTGDEDKDYPTPTGEKTAPANETSSLLSNYIIQSAVDNPVNINASSYVRIGNGTVLGIAGLTTALSQDAYKVSTLLCFTTQGIWAIRENDEGVMTSVAPPFSREICTDSETITMVDNGVFFVSQKGLMCVVATNERSVVCVSNQLSGKGKTEFLDFLTGCHIVYDYRDEQLILYRTDTDKVWIYDLESKTFSTKSHLFKSVIGENEDVKHFPLPQTSVNNYPDYVVQDEDNNLFSVNSKSERDDDIDTYDAVIQSRPMKLDGSLYLKSLRRLRKLMMLNDNAVCNLTLYGSNDLKNWHPLTSLQGKPWRFFKYKCELNNLNATDTFSGLVLDTDVRYTDKPH